MVSTDDRSVSTSPQKKEIPSISVEKATATRDERTNQEQANKTLSFWTSMLHVYWKLSSSWILFREENWNAVISDDLHHRHVHPEVHQDPLLPAVNHQQNNQENSTFWMELGISNAEMQQRQLLVHLSKYKHLSGKADKWSFAYTLSTCNSDEVKCFTWHDA